MMPQLVPQTFMMDQQLELPSSWYGDGSDKQGLGGGRAVAGGLGLELASPLNPDELFTCLGAVPNEWGLQEESFMVEPEPVESPVETASGTLFTLEDYDDALASLVPSGTDLPESFVGRPSRVAADGALDNLLGPDDKCGDGWAVIGPSSRRSDDRICDRSFEDVFQVDTQDLLCSPTLAQLNSEQDGCSDLLDDIANAIVKDEYATVSEEVASGSASAQPCVLQTSALSSSRTDRIEHVPSVAAFGFGCAPALSLEAPTVSFCRFATSPGNASSRIDRRASVPAGGTLPAASSSTAAEAVAHAKAIRPPEKRRRLSDSVTLYDLLISKSSPQQLQVLMNRRGEGGLMLSRGTAERHEAAGQQLQHKKPRHGTVATFSAAAAAASAVSSGVPVSDSGSLFADSCGDCQVEASPTAKPVVHEPRRRTSLPAASLTRTRQPSECSTVSTFDEGLDEEDGCGYTSDADSCSSCSTWTSKDGKQRQHRPQRQQRHSPYFWQYNSQSKGPRGERFELTLAPSDDPHKPVNFTDPVFDPEQHVRIRHVGRARKGDGNDVRPNPRRLVSIGKELAKLNRLMNDVTAPTAGSSASFVGAAESGSAGRPDSKREKNKLASRACRLKKKAQHEANKVKLCGLEQERKELMAVLDSLKVELQKHRVGWSPQDAKTSSSELYPIIGVESPSFSATLRELTSRHLVTKVAGRTSQFVSEVVALVEAGDPLGGLVVTED